MILRLSGLLVIAALVAACPATSSGLANASASTPAAQASANADLAAMTVDQAIMYRDGGTIAVKGKLPDGTDVTVRLDGAYGSETRGVFFITRGDGPERRLDRSEAGPVVTAVERAVAAPGSTLDSKVTDPFLEKLKAFRDGA